MRLGWGLWPEDLIAGAIRLQINSNSCASAASQVAGVEALTGPQDAVDAMVAAFDERRLFIHEQLNAIDGFRCARPQGAFYAFPNIAGTGLTSDEAQAVLLDDLDVAVISGTSFGPFGEGHIRISYAASIEQIADAMDRLRTRFGGSG